MNKKIVFFALTSLLATGSAFAGTKGFSGKMETCLNAALAKHPGEVLSLEAETNKGKPQYEFDIKGKDGKEWEVECLAKTGKVIEDELEVAADAPEFKSKAKVSLEDAKKTALEKFPGEVIETEYAIESDGTLSYEFDIVMKDGKEMEVEVDAVTGKLSDDIEEEIYQIGAD